MDLLSRSRIRLALSAAILLGVPGILVLGPRPAAPQVVTSRALAVRHPPDWQGFRRNPIDLPTPAPVELASLAASPSQVAPAPAPPPAPPTAIRPVLPPPPPPVRPPAPPPPRPPVGSTQQALINQDRAGAGLPSLTWSPCLARIALQNAQRMAAQRFISHTNGPQLDLGCGLGNRAGENVGFTSAGIDDAQLNTLFMESPEHRANIMGPYRYVGTAWVVAGNGYGYVAVEFS